MSMKGFKKCPGCIERGDELGADVYISEEKQYCNRCEIELDIIVKEAIERNIQLQVEEGKAE